LPKLEGMRWRINLHWRRCWKTGKG
jgi:hypothetical protein